MNLKITPCLLVATACVVSPLALAQPAASLENLPSATNWAGSYVGIAFGRSGERRTVSSAASSASGVGLSGSAAYCLNTRSGNSIPGQTTEASCLTRGFGKGKVSGDGGAHVWFPGIEQGDEDEIVRDSNFHEVSQRSSRSAVGLKLGHNWQAAGERWVYGVELDHTRLRGRDSTITSTATSSTDGADLEVTSSLSGRTRWVSTLRGRVGYTSADNSWLPYLTGGLAWGRSTVQGSFEFNGVAPEQDATTNFGKSGVRRGLVLGVGVDYRINKNLVLGASYMHAKLGGQQFVDGQSAVGSGEVTASAGTGTARVSPYISLMTLGLSYKFD
jgi:opacity protein-like surface antigen